MKACAQVFRVVRVSCAKCMMNRILNRCHAPDLEGPVTTIRECWGRKQPERGSMRPLVLVSNSTRSPAAINCNRRMILNSLGPGIRRRITPADRTAAHNLHAATRFPPFVASDVRLRSPERGTFLEIFFYSRVESGQARQQVNTVDLPI